MSEYKPKCEVCPHYNSCTVQKELTMLYQERFNRSRELAGRTDGFVDGKYVKDALKGVDDEVDDIDGFADNSVEIKQIKYFDEDEKVWKIGSVIVE